MRFILKWASALVVLAFLAPGFAQADDMSGGVEEQLRLMQQRLTAMEDRLDAANRRMAQQEEILQRGTGGGGVVSEFLRSVEVGGWISASYFYNFNDPDGEALGGGNAGLPPLFYPFHPDANSFEFDQLWFEIEKPIDEQNRAGFRADIVFGKTADILTDFAQDGLSGSDEDLEIYQAYIQYLAPIGSGLTIKAGKFATLMGAEVVQAPYNFNITRGNVYNLLQPITHVGVLASYELGHGLDVALGYVNENVSPVDIDLNNRKSVLWHVGWGNDTFSASFNGLFGSSDSFFGTIGNEEQDETIYDLVLTWDPSERLSTWLNADYRVVDSNMAPEGTGWGVAVAGRYAWTDRLGTSLRAEYVDDDGGIFGAGRGNDLTIWGITGTVDYSLTENLLLRGEVRYDRTEGNGAVPPFTSGDKHFISDSSHGRAVAGGPVLVNFSDLEETQVVAGVELIYSF